MNIWHVLELIKNYGSPIALVITWAAIVLVWYERRASWRRKEFINQASLPEMGKYFLGKLAPNYVY